MTSARLVVGFIVVVCAMVGEMQIAQAAAEAGESQAREPGVIQRRPAARAGLHAGEPLARIPAYDPQSQNPFDVDLRARDLSGLDLREAGGDLAYAQFDSLTVWPGEGKMPRGFRPKQLLLAGRNPGLGVRSLHARGITGKGVSVAIIDQPLLIEHEDYADRIRLYEEIGIPSDLGAEMHGPAVASILVGKACGVAPEADLYYIAAYLFDVARRRAGEKDDRLEDRFYAQAVTRILEINERLAADRKIRVISISASWNEDHHNYPEMVAAVERAKKAGMLVISACAQRTHGFAFRGLRRDMTASVDSFAAYAPGSWWAAQFAGGWRSGKELLVPMESRSVASQSGAHDYCFHGRAGVSWAIPYIAGTYAMAAQVDPSITPERFWALAMKTGRTVTKSHNGRRLELGPIIDPVRLVGALQAGARGPAATSRPQ